MPLKRSAPRLLVVSPAPAVKRQPELFSGLLEEGAELVFSADSAGFPPEILEHPRVSTVDLPFKRLGRSGRAVEILRAAADVVRFLAPGLERASAPRARACRRLVRLAGFSDLVEAASRLAAIRLPAETAIHLRDSLRALEQLLPPTPELLEAVAALEPDAVLCVTRSVLGGTDADIAKVARHLGLPTVTLVWSWDNLSGKAVIKEDPDRLLVWNDVMAAEAIEQHGVAADRVTVVGAAIFDRFFAELQQIPPARSDAPKMVFYLCSTGKIAPDEPRIAGRWIAALRSSGDPIVRDVRVVVRPHPAVESWQRWKPPDDRVELLEPYVKSDRHSLAHLLRTTTAVVALNTSAELEAAISGVPVLTFRAGADAPGQEGSAHFEYLLEQHGGFVLDAETLEEHLAALGRVLRGEYDREVIDGFVRRFVRPNGVDRPVTPTVVAEILQIARMPRTAAAEPALPATPQPERTNGRPRILIVAPPEAFRAIAGVVESLFDAGAELVFAGEPLEAVLAQPRAESTQLPLTHQGASARGAAIVRGAGEVLRLLGADGEAASPELGAAVQALLELAGHADVHELGRSPQLRVEPKAHERLTAAVDAIERLLPPPPGLESALFALDADSLLLVSSGRPGGFDLDVLKAARAIGLPTKLVSSSESLGTGAAGGDDASPVGSQLAAAVLEQAGALAPATD